MTKKIERQKPAPLKRQKRIVIKRVKPERLERVKPLYIKPRELLEIESLLVEMSEHHGFGSVSIDIFCGSVSGIHVHYKDPEKCKPSIITMNL
jgi:hypothetical protein